MIPPGLQRGVAVTLRPAVAGDLPVLFSHRCDDAARRMAAFVSADPEDWTDFEAKWLEILAEAENLVRIVEVDGVVAGYAGCHPQFGVVSISYWLGREYWGRGVARRAVAALLEEVAARPVYARVVANNAASLRVLAGCGFREVGRERSFAPGRGEAVEEVILELTGSA